MKAIEPGCLAIVTGGPFKVVVGTVVTVVKRANVELDTSVKEGWIIQSQLIDSIIKYNNARVMVVAEKILRRIDDDDFDPFADSEENPYVKTMWTPVRQV